MSDSLVCVFQGYVKRQALYACNSCTPKGGEPAGVCLACSYKCHEGHDLFELYTKRLTFKVSSHQHNSCSDGEHPNPWVNEPADYESIRLLINLTVRYNLTDVNRRDDVTDSCFFSGSVGTSAVTVETGSSLSCSVNSFL